MTPLHTKSPVVGSLSEAAPSSSTRAVTPALSDPERRHPGTPRDTSVEVPQPPLSIPPVRSAPSPSLAPSSIPPVPGPLPTASLGKTQTVFIYKLYDMLEDPSLSHLIWWSPTSDSFYLYPGEEFSNVLAHYFKHTNIASFIRQLNMYGFHKVNDSFQNDDKSLSSGQPPAHQTAPSSTRWEFRHSANQFRKGDVHSLSLIKRKSSKVINSHKEIVSLKSLPPTSNMGEEKVNAFPDQTHLLSHRAVFQQLWDQNDIPNAKSALPELSTPTPLNAPSTILTYHTYPLYPHLVAAANVPHSPGSPPYPEYGVASPSYISQSQLQPQLRQASVQTPGIPVDQSINLKLIEMNNSITNLKTGYLELLSRYDSLASLYQRSQSELYQLTEIIEKVLSKSTNDPEVKRETREPDHIDRSKTKTPIDRVTTPGHDSGMSPMSVKPSSKCSELDSFKHQLLQKMNQPIPTASSGQKNHHHNYHLDDVSLTLSKGANSSHNIVPQHYPLNPNYSLYNGSDGTFRQFKMSNEEIHQRQKGPPSNRHVSVFMDPLQPIPNRTTAANPTSLGPDGKEKPPSDGATQPYVQQYQSHTIHQPPVHALYQYIRQEPLQQRTVSLPIIEKTLPANLMPQQRHLTTTISQSPPHVVQPRAVDAAKVDRSGLIAVAQSPRSNRPPTPQGQPGLAVPRQVQHLQQAHVPLVQHVQHAQSGQQMAPIQRPSHIHSLPHLPHHKVEPMPVRIQTPPRDLKLPLRNQLPSVSELDKSIKSSGPTGRVYDLLLDSGEERKKRKVET